MKASMNWQDYQKVTSALKRSRQQENLGSKLNNLWQTLAAHLLTSSEPHVWTTQDKSGHTHWKAYDPITGQSVHFVTEEAMRIWLEERHYQYHLAA